MKSKVRNFKRRKGGEEQGQEWDRFILFYKRPEKKEMLEGNCGKKLGRTRGVVLAPGLTSTKRNEGGGGALSSGAFWVKGGKYERGRQLVW